MKLCFIEDVFNICGRFVIISGWVHCSVVLALCSHRQVSITFSIVVLAISCLPRFAPGCLWVFFLCRD